MNQEVRGQFLLSLGFHCFPRLRLYFTNSRVSCIEFESETRGTKKKYKKCTATNRTSVITTSKSTWQCNNWYQIQFSSFNCSFKKMSVTQDWGNVWTGPRSFHPSTVPLPLRQGYREPQEQKPTPDKFANTELMKIPNFLHLTPPVVERQCEALKKFCTPWPAGLETEEKCDKHFPIEYITSDYCQGLPTIRNPLARIITLRVSNWIFFFFTHSSATHTFVVISV